MSFLTTLFILITILAAYVLLIAVLFSKDIRATQERDPAAKGYLQIILLYAGLHALIAHRVAHRLCGQ